eukprot:1137150-Pelagomonas_calceolata.AAC.3
MGGITRQSQVARALQARQEQNYSMMQRAHPTAETAHARSPATPMLVFRTTALSLPLKHCLPHMLQWRAWWHLISLPRSHK